MRIDLGGFARLSGRRRINGVAKLLRRLEEGNAFGGHIHLRSGLGIAAGPGVALPRPETAESANLNLVSGFQCSDDGIKQSIDDDFAVAAGKVAQGGDFVDKVSFSHNCDPFLLGGGLRPGRSSSC